MPDIPPLGSGVGVDLMDGVDLLFELWRDDDIRCTENGTELIDAGGANDVGRHERA